MPSAEILAVLADEVTEASSAIDVALAGLAGASDDAAFAEALTEYVERVQRIAFAGEALGLEGLKRVCGFVESNIGALTVGGLSAEHISIFARWPQLVLGYLKTPLDGVYSQELIELFQRDAWPLPLDSQAAQEIEQALLTFNDIAEHEQPARQTVAQPEDVVLDIPDDVNRQLVDAFLTEGPMQAGEYSALIQRVAQGDGFVDELNECRRLIHALKGAGNTVGVRGVATLCHHVEDILEYLVENGIPLQGDLARLLTKVADTLEIMFEALLGTGEPPADALAVLQKVLDWGNRLDRGEYDPAAPSDSPALVSASANVETAAESDEHAPAKAAPQVEPKVRVAARVIDNLLQTSGEMTISSGHVKERLQQAFKALTELRERHAALWERASDMEGFVTTQGIAAGRRQALASANAAALPGFDALELDQYSELHTYAHGLTETVADLQMLGTRLVEALTAVDTAVGQQGLLNDELHDLLMNSRMVPAGTIESRLQRTVRQAAEQCEKIVTLRVEGTDVRLDDQMVNLLIDPLQHLLRNAVDHGIEAPNARAAAGKVEAGNITLAFSRDGNYLMIACSDDGAGLNLDRIRKHAIESGIITEDQNLSADETARLILRHGFSTASAVTEVSGRGVGMDIVHTQVARLKGTIDIRTEAGRGVTFTLRVPMSLGIVHCLLVNAEDETFALPTDNLERIIYDGAAQVGKTDSGWVYSDAEVTCPAHPLARLVGSAESAEGAREERQRHVVLMNTFSGRTAIIVDAVTGGSDLVIKNMGRYLANVRGVIGASILGDGRVVPILELPQLLSTDGPAVVRAQRVGAGADATLQGDILIVDDSLSARTALITLLTEEGFRVRTAKDGVEAIEAIGERLPTLVLADLEMPRMNGLELTSHIRNNPSTRDLPVIMITSRTAEKHRNLARSAGVTDYLTKPFREQDLLARLRTFLRAAA